MSATQARLAQLGKRMDDLEADVQGLAAVVALALRTVLAVFGRTQRPL